MRLNKPFLILLLGFLSYFNPLYGGCEEELFELENDSLKSLISLSFHPVDRYQLADAKCMNNPESSEVTQNFIEGLDVDKLESLSKSLLNGTPLSEACSSPISYYCQLVKELGEDESKRHLTILGKFGFNSSHLKTKNALEWGIDDLGLLIDSLGDLPGNFYPFKNNHKLVRLKSPLVMTEDERGRVAHLRGGAYGHIEVFDLWDSLPDYKKRISMVHEVGHLISYMNSTIASNMSWTSLSDWEKSSVRNIYGRSEVKFRGSSSENFVSLYAMENQHEDFAESLVAFRYNPELLKEQSLEKYNILKGMFAGVEYNKEESCSRATTPEIEKIKSDFEDTVNNMELNNSEAKLIYTKCHESALKTVKLEGRLSFEAPEECYEKSLQEFIIAEHLGGLSSDTNIAHILPNLEFSSSKLQSKKEELLGKVKGLHAKNIKTSLKSGINKIVKNGFITPNIKCYAPKDEDKLPLYFVSPNSRVSEDEKNEYIRIVKESCVKLKASRGILDQVSFMSFKESEVERLF